METILLELRRYCILAAFSANSSSDLNLQIHGAAAAQEAPPTSRRHNLLSSFIGYATQTMNAGVLRLVTVRFFELNLSSVF